MWFKLRKMKLTIKRRVTGGKGRVLVIRGRGEEGYISLQGSQAQAAHAHKDAEGGERRRRNGDSGDVDSNARWRVQRKQEPGEWLGKNETQTLGGGCL